MRQLPLLTILVLVVGILAWNVSFYGEFYRARSAGLPVRAEGHAAQMGSVESGRVGEPVIAARAEAGEVIGSEAGPAHSSASGSDQRAPAGEGPAEESAEVRYDYPDGSRKSVGTLLGGRRDGPWTEYWENGRTLMAGEFVRGERDGEWEFFHEGGEMRSRGNYVAGLRDGPWQSFDGHGRRRSEGRYSAELGGERVGLWSQYYTDGSPKSQGVYVRGVMQGFWLFNEPEGNPGPRTGDYVDGALVRN